MTLFQFGEFTAHSGTRLPFKIDCDALSDEDLRCLATLALQRLPPFGLAIGVPRGGLQFAETLKAYGSPLYLPPLIVDDVLTTGASMERTKSSMSAGLVYGLVIFARGPCMDWVTPIFRLDQRFW
jgi:orotate phosphoribosyltransferase